MVSTFRFLYYICIYDLQIYKLLLKTPKNKSEKIYTCQSQPKPDKAFLESHKSFKVFIELSCILNKLNIQYVALHTFSGFAHDRNFPNSRPLSAGDVNDVIKPLTRPL